MEADKACALEPNKIYIFKESIITKSLHSSIGKDLKIHSRDAE